MENKIEISNDDFCARVLQIIKEYDEERERIKHFTPEQIAEMERVEAMTKNYNY